MRLPGWSGHSYDCSRPRPIGPGKRRLKIMLLLEIILKSLPLVSGQRLVKVDIESLGLTILSIDNVLTRSYFIGPYSYREAVFMLSTR